MFRALVAILVVIAAMQASPARSDDRAIRAILGIGAGIIRNELDRKRPRPLHRMSPAASRDADGLSRAEIVAYQKALITLGFDVGEPDGKLGPATGRAIAAFVRSLGRDPRTTKRREAYQMAIAAAAAAATNGGGRGGAAAATLAGAGGPAGDTLSTSDVLAYQEALNRLGFHVGEPDGQIGPATGRAIAAFVRSRGRDPNAVKRREAFAMALAAANGTGETGIAEAAAGAAATLATAAASSSTAQEAPRLLPTALDTERPEGSRRWELASGETCDGRRAIIDRLGRDMKVAFDRQDLSVGEKAVASWQRGAFPEREPVFLMLAFSEPVRLGGEAFYGLLPNARAAYDIGWSKDLTRAVVPLFGRGAPVSGAVEIQPLFAGEMTVEWTVVGYDGCGVHHSADGAGKATLRASAAGKPQIVVNDPTDLGTPKNVVVSPDGTRQIVVYEDRFRLLDTATGAELLERAGTNPLFSPTGRFVTVKTQDRRNHLDDQKSIIDGVLVVDALDGGRVLFTQFWKGGWHNADSMLVVNWGGWGLTTVFDATSARAIAADVEMATCRICGFDPPLGFGLSVEDNYLVLVDTQTYKNERPGRVMTASLTGGNIGGAADPAAAARLAAAATGVTRSLSGGAVAPAALLEAASPPSDEQSPAENSGGEGSMLSEARSGRSGTGVQVASVSNKTQVLSWRQDLGPQSGALEPDLADQTFIARLADFGFAVAAEVGTTLWKEGEMDEEAVAPPQLDTAAAASERRAILDAYDRRKQEIRRRFTNRIADETGLARASFRPMRTCGLFEDPNGGELEQAGEGDAAYTPLFMDRAWRWVSGSSTFWLTQTECADGSAAFLYPSTQLHSSGNGGRRISMTAALNNDDTDIGNICPTALDACGFDVRVFGDDLVVWSAKANGVGVYDTATNTMRMKRFGIPQGDIMDGAHLLEDRQHLLVTFRNGQFLILRMADGSIALNGRYADDEVVVWVSDGRFDATSEGASFVSFQFPGRIGEYSFQQFDAKLRVPGLIEKVLAGTLDERTIALSPPPDVTATMELAENGPADRIEIAASAKGSEPVARFQLFQDGLLTDTIDVAQPGRDADWAGEVRRLPGTRWLSILATDAASVVSLPVGRDLGPSKAAKRRVHVLSIGIETFDDPRIAKLDGPAEDARTFAATLDRLAAADGCEAEIASQTVLLNGDATGERILAEIQRLVDRVPAGETIALFYAGHGLQAKDKRYYLVPSAARVADLEQTALPWRALAEIIGQAKTRVAVFIDACQSGFAGSDLFATNDAAVGSILDAAPSGVVVFAASKGRQAAIESDSEKGGYFTRAIEHALLANRQATDRNGNGAIEISELYGAIKRDVVAKTKGRQTPWIARNQMVGDFTLF